VDFSTGEAPQPPRGVGVEEGCARATTTKSFLSQNDVWVHFDAYFNRQKKTLRHKFYGSIAKRSIKQCKNILKNHRHAKGGGRRSPHRPPPTLTPNIRHWTQLPKNSHLEWAMNSPNNQASIRSVVY